MSLLIWQSVGFAVVLIIYLFLHFQDRNRDGNASRYLDQFEIRNSVFWPSYIVINARSFGGLAFIGFGGLGALLIWLRIEFIPKEYGGIALLGIVLCFSLPLLLLFVFPSKRNSWANTRIRHQKMRIKKFETWNQGPIERSEYTIEEWPPAREKIRVQKNVVVQDVKESTDGFERVHK